MMPLGQEIDLLDRCPRSKRPIEQRGRVISEHARAIARQYGPEFFDGDRLYGYGGYRYDGRWGPVAERFRDHYQLPSDARILDVGCAKGFLLRDFQELLPQATVTGIDVSRYALQHAESPVRRRSIVGCASHLPFADQSFDLVLSINTIHNLPRPDCRKALREIERVSRGPCFITVDAWRDDLGRERLLKWMLTAETFMSVEEWKQFFAEAGYRGDHYWFFA